jgi:hypothetical protein
MLLRNAWYIAAWADELAAQPLAGDERDTIPPVAAVVGAAG